MKCKHREQLRIQLPHKWAEMLKKLADAREQTPTTYLIDRIEELTEAYELHTNSVV